MSTQENSTLNSNNESSPICPVKFDESLIGKEFIYFDVPGEPFAKQRPRAARKGKYITIYTPVETRNYENKVCKYYNKIYGSKMLKGPLTVEIEGIFSTPNSASKATKSMMLNGEISHTKKPDCDNMAKICLDALNGVAYPDDAIINKLYISKKYGENAMIKILIKESS